MRVYQKLLFVCSVLALLAGCDQQAMFEKLIPKNEAAVAQRALSDVIARNFSAVDGLLDPTLQTPATRNGLDKLASAFPAGQPKNVNIVGAQTRTLNNVTTYDLTYEYEYPNAWLLANVMLRRQDGKLRILGIHAYPQKQSLREANRFTFVGKSALHYLMFGLTIGVALFVIYALVLCFRTPIAKRKWLWLLFVALGFVQFFFNWTNGAFRVQPISVALLGSGFYRSGPYAPLILSFSIPIGAIVFLLRRRALIAGSANSVDSNQTSSAPPAQ